MMLADLLGRHGNGKYPEATTRYVDRVLGTESDERVLAEEFIATSTDYGGRDVVKPAGELVPPERLWAIRELVLDRLQEEGFDPIKPLKDKEKTRWDRIVGAALLECIDMEPFQLFDHDAWTYLSVHLLPEFAGWRFPGRQSQAADEEELVKPRDRVMGGRRNVLYRVWFRARVLGANLQTPAGADPLGEDELDNIFGRPTISRNHELTRRIVATIYRNSPRGSERRRKAVRELLKEIRRKYATVHFTALDDELDAELDKLWRLAIAAVQRVR